MSSKFLARKDGDGNGDDDDQKFTTNTTTPYLPQPLLTSLNGGTPGSYSNTTCPVDIVQTHSVEPSVNPTEVLLRHPSLPASCPSSPDLFTRYLNGDTSDLQFGGHIPMGNASGNFNDMSGLLFEQPVFGSPLMTLSQHELDFTGFDMSPEILFSQEGYGSTMETGTDAGPYEQDRQTTLQAADFASGQRSPPSRPVQMSNALNQTRPPSKAQQQFDLDFPNGATTIYTSGEALECALHAIQSSFRHQLQRLDPPSIGELRSIAVSDVIDQRFHAAGLGPVDINNFSADHVAAILQEYARRHGHILQLGIRQNHGDPFIQYSSNPSATTLWIHNDNGQSATTFGHYSGLKPNNGEGQIGQYDRTGRTSLGQLADAPTSSTVSPTPPFYPSGVALSWELPCLFCEFGEHGQYLGRYYGDQNELALHQWMVHPNLQHWTPQHCLWIGCISGTVYLTSEEWLTHVFTAHRLWEPQPCPREDCDRAVEAYLTWNKCLKHNSSVHNKSYTCDNPEPCEVKRLGKVFGTLQDKQRHDHDIHEPKKKCTLPYCKSTKRLNRPQHKKEHMRDWHGPFCCKVEDRKHGTICSRGRIDGQDYGFSTQAKLDEHMKKNRHKPVSRRGN